MKRKGRKWRRFVGNADNCRYRSPRRMQVYKPFRLRGPLDGGASNAPALSLSLSLFLSVFVPSSSPPGPLCSLPRDPFCAIYQPALALLPPRAAAVLQFQPHFCASLSRRANSDKAGPRERERERERDFIRYRRAYRRALFFQATHRHFRKNPRAA